MPKDTKDNDLFFTLGLDRARANIEEKMRERRYNEEKVNNILEDMSQLMNDIKPAFIQNYENENLQSDEPTLIRSNEEKNNKSTGASESAPAPLEQNKRVKLLERSLIRGLDVKLKEKVFGQDEILDEVVDILKVAALNIKINKEKPAGCYLFAGPSGVGKTEVAVQLSQALDVPLLKIDMGEYGMENDITKLIGAPPGYKGFEQGGKLTNFGKENKVGIILLDEYEKGHETMDNILLSIMDKGVCTDGQGNTVEFKEYIVIVTSNLGAEVEYHTELDKNTKNAYRMEAIKERIRPEIIGRYDSVFHFNSLALDIYKKVAEKFFKGLNEQFQQEHKIELKQTVKLIDYVVEKSFDPALGGRPARKFIEKIVIKSLADYMLDPDFEKIVAEHKEITLDMNKQGNVCFKGKNKKILGVLENTAQLVERIEENKMSNKKAKP